jgi:hypothetical protein
MIFDYIEVYITTDRGCTPASGIWFHLKYEQKLCREIMQKSA